MVHWLMAPLLALGSGTAGAIAGNNADTTPQAASVPGLLEHSLRLLHSNESFDLRQLAGRPLLIVNTASHCGFTGQFKGLEALHREYGDRGLVVLGFPSNDFNQESGNEAETAEICYVNYGVSFTMFAPVSVRGSDAHPVFAELARQSGAPKWNFYKYLVDGDGKVVAWFNSMTRPDSAKVTSAIESLL